MVTDIPSQPLLIRAREKVNHQSFDPGNQYGSGDHFPSGINGDNS
jgi:hypothetical protein